MSNHKFESVYRNHIEALQSFALKLTRNKMDADDLVQETAIKAFRSFGSYKRNESFKNWSFTILKNTYITKYNRRRKRNIITTPIEEIYNIPYSTTQIEPKPNSNRKLKTVLNFIEKLSAKSREPFKMYMNGYTYKEISQYLGIPVGTVKSRINFARTKLKNHYQKTTSSSLALTKVA